jgi:hypothetical protein
MKKKLLLFVGLMISVLSYGQNLIDRGGYADYKNGYSHKYHLDNVKKLISNSGLDTTNYKNVEFLPNEDLIKGLIDTEKRSYVTMEIVNNQIATYSVVNHPAKNPQSNPNKIFCIFYFRSDVTNKITYYLYMYG